MLGLNLFIGMSNAKIRVLSYAKNKWLDTIFYVITLFLKTVSWRFEWAKYEAWCVWHTTALLRRKYFALSFVKWTGINLCYPLWLGLFIVQNERVLDNFIKVFKSENNLVPNIREHHSWSTTAWRANVNILCVSSAVWISVFSLCKKRNVDEAEVNTNIVCGFLKKTR